MKLKVKKERKKSWKNSGLKAKCLSVEKKGTDRVKVHIGIDVCCKSILVEKCEKSNEKCSAKMKWNVK